MKAQTITHTVSTTNLQRSLYPNSDCVMAVSPPEVPNSWRHIMPTTSPVLAHSSRLSPSLSHEPLIYLFIFFTSFKAQTKSSQGFPVLLHLLTIISCPAIICQLNKKLSLVNKQLMRLIKNVETPVTFSGRMKSRKKSYQCLYIYTRIYLLASPFLKTSVSILEDICRIWFSS